MSWLDTYLADALTAGRLKSPSNDWTPDGLGPSYGLKTTATTTNNTPTTVDSFTLPDNAETTVYADVQMRRSDAGDGAEFQLKGVWYRYAGGAPVVVKAPTVTDSNPNASGTAWSAALVISGNNVLVQVTGDTGKTIVSSVNRVANVSV